MFDRGVMVRGAVRRRVAAGVLGLSVALSGLAWAPTAVGVAAPIYLNNCGTLSQGSSGGCVVELQNLLVQQGYSPGTVDGVFGNNTKTAVRNFQSATGLAVDGIVGPNTKSKLYTRQVTATSSTCPARLSQALSSRGGCVAYIQARLNAVYSAGLAVDGVFGAATNTAVRNYQTSRCLTVDGIVEANTKSALVNNKARCQYTIPGAVEYNQTRDNWCWAGVIRMAAKMVTGADPGECAVAALVKNGKASPCPTSDTQATPDEVRTGLTRVGMANHTLLRGGMTSLAVTKSSIDQNRPIIVRVQQQYAYHYLVIFGYKSISDSSATLYYFDPFKGTDGTKSQLYSSFTSTVSIGTSWRAVDTIYNIRK